MRAASMKLRVHKEFVRKSMKEKRLSTVFKINGVC
jgi:hypothetical protein